MVGSYVLSMLPMYGLHLTLIILPWESTKHEGNWSE